MVGVIYNGHLYLFVFTDDNHKLIRWGLVIHGGIDGYSRLIVFLKCSDNNRGETVKRNAIHEYGIPSHIRADQGGENMQVAEMMLELKGTGRSSVLVGPLVHNQRIEHLWRDLFDRVTGSYYRLLYLLREMWNFRSFNLIHYLCLHFITTY